jgi:hypothetical protein
VLVLLWRADSAVCFQAQARRRLETKRVDAEEVPDIHGAAKIGDTDTIELHIIADANAINSLRRLSDLFHSVVHFFVNLQLTKAAITTMLSYIFCRLFLPHLLLRRDFTALMLAARSGHIPTVRLLLEYRADARAASK